MTNKINFKYKINTKRSKGKDIHEIIQILRSFKEILIKEIICDFKIWRFLQIILNFRIIYISIHNYPLNRSFDRFKKLSSRSNQRWYLGIRFWWRFNNWVSNIKVGFHCINDLLEILDMDITWTEYLTWLWSGFDSICCRNEPKAQHLHIF